MRVPVAPYERFALEREAGAGGMAVVYKATDVETGATVAVKVLRDDAETQRFHREVRVLEELRHPAIVSCLFHGRAPDGRFFYVMEWLEGETLASLLRGRGVSAADAIAIGARVASGLAEAHGHGIIHRDVKPSNLFLEGGDCARLKVLDFGVARRTGDADLTRSGAHIGTPAYMSPEQARGASSLDPRIDVFALGSVLFECLTGRRAFRGDDTMAVLAKILLEDTPRVSSVRDDVPAGLDALVARMMAKKVEERPSAIEVANALETIRAAGELDMAPAPRSSASLTASERRLICVVLVRDSSASFESLREIADAYEGRVEPLADGSCVVLLSAAGVATDLALRAARCALAIRERLPACAIGLATGRTELREREPTDPDPQLSETVDRAARLVVSGQGAAPGGAIHLDEVTSRLVRGRFNVIGAATDPMLESERDEAPVSLLGRRTPCVGREAEIRTLLGCWEEARSEHRARAVIVTGPAGIGKSRLAAEFVRESRAAAAEAQVWIARADADGETFALASQVVRAAAGVLEDDGPPAAMRKIVDLVVSKNADPESDRLRIAEFLGEIAGVRFPEEGRVELRSARRDPILMGDQIRRAWEDFLLGETAAHPVLIVAEDLHWADLPSIKLIDAALRNLEDRPLLVVALARPEVHDRFVELWAERNAMQLRLPPLSRRASETLARAVLGPDAEDDRVARICERAAGNPFFLEELLRAAAYREEDNQPESILAMVQSRLEALDSDSRRVLRAASVVGRTFRHESVAQLLGGTRALELTKRRIEELVTREIVVRADRARALDDTFMFRHAIVRDAAYSMLTEADRTLGHRLAGEWLEKNAVGQPALLAEHFERGGLPERAMVHWLHAAEQALGGNDFGAVIARTARARTCGAAGAILGDLLVTEGEAHMWRGASAEAESCLLQALERLDVRSAKWCFALGELSLVGYRLGRFEPPPGVLETLLHIEPDAEPLAEQVGAAARIAISLLAGGRHERASSLFEWMDRWAECAAWDPLAYARVEAARAARARAAGDLVSYVDGMSASVDAFERAGDARRACHQRINVGYGHMRIGAYEPAEAFLRPAIATATRMGLSATATLGAQNWGILLFRRGCLEEARSILQGATLEFRAQGDPRLEGSTRGYLSRVLLALGDRAGALVEARAAAQMLEVVPPIRCAALAVLARALAEAGEVDEGLACAIEAKRLLDELGEIDEGESLVRLVHAELLVRAHDEAGAKRAISDARERLLERASKLRDPLLRASFLENVPDHARTMELAGSLA